MRMYRYLLPLCLLLPAVPASAAAKPAPDRLLTSGPYTVRVREGSDEKGGGLVRISRRGRVLVTLRDWMIPKAEFGPCSVPTPPISSSKPSPAARIIAPSSI